MPDTVRPVKVVIGFGLLSAGIVMLAVPGPGWLTIAAGLAILADEFPWARRALDAIKRPAAGWRQRLAKEDRHGRNDPARRLSQRMSATPAEIVSASHRAPSHRKAPDS
jgi:uncharacterized protein (TIGR02611 family)